MNTAHPPPLPGSKSAHHAAATFSVIAFLVALVVTVVIGRLGHPTEWNADPAMVRFVSIVSVVLVCGLFGSGIVAGIIALGGIPRHGTRGLLVRGLSGLLLCSLMCVVFVTNFVGGRKPGASSSMR